MLKISGRKSSAVFAVCYMAYTLVYMLRINLSVAGPVLQQSGLIGSVQFGLLGSAFSVIYASGRLINGSLSDRIPPEIMIGIGLPLAGAGNIIFAISISYAAMFFAWVLNAIGQSMLWSSLLHVMRCTYEPAKAKKASAMLVTSICTGNLAAIYLSSLLIRTLGVRFAFTVPAIISLVTAAVSYFVIKPVTAQSFKPDKSVSHAGKSLLQQLKADSTLRGMLVLACGHGVIKENIIFWMTVIVMARYGLDIKASAMYVLLVPLIGLAGRLLFNPVFKLCNYNEEKLSSVAFTVSLAVSAVLCIGSIGPALSIFCMGSLYAALSMCNTALISIFPARYAQQGMMAGISGLFDFTSYLGTALGSFVYGAAAVYFGYNFIFISWAVICLLSVVLIAYIRAKQR